MLEVRDLGTPLELATLSQANPTVNAIKAYIEACSTEISSVNLRGYKCVRQVLKAAEVLRIM